MKKIALIIPSFAFFSATLAIIHIVIKYDYFGVNALIFMSLRDAGTPMDPFLIWLLLVLLGFGLLFLGLWIDKRFLLKLDTKDYVLGLIPLNVAVLLFLPLDVILFGELYHKGLWFLPIIIFLSAIVVQSLELWLLYGKQGTQIFESNAKKELRSDNGEKKRFSNLKLRIIVRAILIPCVAVIFFVLFWLLLNNVFPEVFGPSTLFEFLGVII